jgi:hypothetical protein
MFGSRIRTPEESNDTEFTADLHDVEPEERAFPRAGGRRVTRTRSCRQRRSLVPRGEGVTERRCTSTAASFVVRVARMAALPAEVQ